MQDTNIGKKFFCEIDEMKVEYVSNLEFISLLNLYCINVIYKYLLIN